jgi:hypothetical protein
MQAPDKRIFTMRTGALLSEKDALFLANRVELAAANVAHTMIFYWHADEGWSGQMVETTLHSIAASRSGPKRAFAVSGEGLVVDLINTPLTPYFLLPVDDKRRPISRVIYSGGTFYAVGGGGLVYEQAFDRSWRKLDRGIPLTSLHESLAVDADNAPLCVGWSGGIWQLSQNTWRQADTPTNAVLTDVCVCPDGLAVACGQRGTVLRGRGLDWEKVPHKTTNENLWSITCFEGRVLASSTHFLFELTDNTFTRLSLGDEVPVTVGILSSIEGQLLCVGENDVMMLRAEEWLRVW